MASSPIESLLGPTLKSKSANFPTTSALGTSEVVALYFSASWCGPCQKFTPMLTTAYNGLKSAGKNFEVVFVSSDQDEASFDKYYSKMPWLALPFAERDLKAKLSKKYKVKGIPTLVLVDGATGETLSTDGIETVMGDPKGAQFPWRPKSVAELLGDSLVGPSGEGQVPTSSLKGKNLALYFSASWCPPCRAFTPTLAATYQALKASGRDDFEFVFLSSDKDPASFRGYHAHMPFPALPFEKRAEFQGLMSKFGVQGFPTLLTVDSEGQLINKSARGPASADPTGAQFPWPPSLVEELSQTAECNGSDVNETTSLVVFADGADSDVHAICAGALKSIASEHESARKASGEDPEFIFFTANRSGGPVPQVKTLTGQNPNKATCGDSDAPPVALLLDIPDRGGFYLQTLPVGVAEGPGGEEAVATALRAFLAEYKAGSLTRQQLKSS